MALFQIYSNSAIAIYLVKEQLEKACFESLIQTRFAYIPLDHSFKRFDYFRDPISLKLDCGKCKTKTEVAKRT